MTSYKSAWKCLDVFFLEKRGGGAEIDFSLATIRIYQTSETIHSWTSQGAWRGTCREPTQEPTQLLWYLQSTAQAAELSLTTATQSSQAKLETVKMGGGHFQAKTPFLFLVWDHIEHIQPMAQETTHRSSRKRSFNLQLHLLKLLSRIDKQVSDLETRTSLGEASAYRIVIPHLLGKLEQTLQTTGTVCEQFALWPEKLSAGGSKGVGRPKQGQASLWKHSGGGRRKTRSSRPASAM